MIESFRLGDTIILSQKKDFEKDSIIQNLKQFGLSTYEAAVISILLYSDKPLSGNEVAKRIGITRYYVFEILKTLTQKNFVYVTPTRPKQYHFSISILQDKITETENYYDNLINLVKEKGPFTIISELKDFNINAERVYIALKNKNHTVQSISKATRIPDYTVRQVLKQFKQYDLVRTRRSNKSILYFLYPAEEATKKIINYLSELKEKRLKALYFAYNKITSQVKNKERILDEEIKVIEVTGLENIIKRVRTLIQKSSYLISIRGKELFESIRNNKNQKEINYEFNSYLEELMRFIRRNGKVKLIFSNYFLTVNDFNKMFSALSRYKDLIDVRLFNGPIYDIDIFDKKTIIEYLGGTPFKAIIIINHPKFVSAQCEMFKLLWNKSQNFYYAYSLSNSYKIEEDDYSYLLDSLPVLRGESGINVVKTHENAINVWFYLIKNAKRRIYHVRYFPEVDDFPLDKYKFNKSYSLFYKKGRENLDIKLISNFPDYIIKKIDENERIKNINVKNVKAHVHHHLNSHIGFDIIDDTILIAFNPDDYLNFNEYKVIIVNDDILLNFMLHDFNMLWTNSYDARFLSIPYLKSIESKKKILKELDKEDRKSVV